MVLKNIIYITLLLLICNIVKSVDTNTNKEQKLFYDIDHKHEHHEHKQQNVFEEPKEEKDCGSVRIAIIGSGIGGSSCAYYIHEQLSNNKQPPSITIYEREIVGGRTRNVDLHGKYTELGGSIVHPLNENIITLIKDLGLEIKKSTDDKHLAIWNGNEFVFSQHSIKLINNLKMLYNYHLSPIKFKSARDEIIGKFLKGYNISEPFTSVDEFYSNLGLLNTTKMTAKDYLVDQVGVSKEFVEDILSAGMRVNYNQDYDNLSAFAAFIGLAGTDDGLFAVVGGNYQVAERLIKKSNSNLLHGHEVVQVEKIKNNDGKVLFKVTSKTGDETSELTTKEYDIVVVSTPIEFSDIDFKGVSFTRDSLPKKDYKKVHVHLIAAQSINASYFGKPKDTQIDCILTSFNKSLPFFSLCENSRGKLDDGRIVYKIFAPSRLPDKYIDQLFNGPQLLHYHVWSAYPVLTPGNFPPIILDSDGLYYNNAFEHSISTIETTTISSKNTARLISKYLSSK